MPFYTFKCPLCECEEEVLQKFDDAAPTCEKCTKMVPRHIVDMERIIGAPSIRFKGKGFYETDYKKKKEKPK